MNSAGLSNLNNVFLPVIHVANLAQTLENAETSIRAGADGVFLISHKPSVNCAELNFIFGAVRERFPDLWIGINYLDLPDPAEAFNALPPTANGLWVDNARLDSSLSCQQYIQAAREKRPEVLYFGAVAFKYQNQPDDPAIAAAMATPFMDVVTTSGEGTGKPPELQKIVSMKEAIGEHELAIASGVNMSNVRQFKPYVKYFLVASGVSYDFDYIDLELATDLSSEIHRG